MPPPRHLFVYGSLKRGNANPFARLLAEGSEFTGRAYVKGRLVRLKHYCGATLGRDAARPIVGEISKLMDARRLLRILDRYEGPGFRRVVAKAVLRNGSRLRCWLYEYRGGIPADDKLKK